EVKSLFSRVGTLTPRKIKRGRRCLRPLRVLLPERYFLGLLRFHSCHARHSSNSWRSALPDDCRHFRNSSLSSTVAWVGVMALLDRHVKASPSIPSPGGSGASLS